MFFIGGRLLRSDWTTVYACLGCRLGGRDNSTSPLVLMTFVTELSSNGCNYHVLQQRVFLCLRFYMKSAPNIRRSYSSAFHFQKLASGSNSSVTITFSIDQLAHFIPYAMLLVSSDLYTSHYYAIYIYIGECVCVCVSFWAYTRRRLWSDRDQIRHTHGDSSRNGNGRNKNYPV